MDTWPQDLRYAFRALARTPGSTALAILTLALAIGANTTLFTLVSRALFEPPPMVTGADRLAGFAVAREASLGSYLQYPDFEFYRRSVESFDDIAGYSADPTPVITEIRTTRGQARSWFVTGNFFEVLGVGMAHGRAFEPAEDRTPGTHPVVIASHGFWSRELGADPAAIGSHVTLNGAPFTLVGVTPAGFRGVSPMQQPPDLYLPVMMAEALRPQIALTRAEGQNTLYLRVFGRLAPGVRIEAAEAELGALAPAWEAEIAGGVETIGGPEHRVVLFSRFHLRPHSAAEIGGLFRLWTLVLGSVLLIACANVAILLLAKGSVRAREMGIRAALGARRRWIVRQLLTESFLLGAAGGTAGLLVSAWTVVPAARLIPGLVADEFGPDPRVLAFTVFLCTATAILFGLAPAWQQSRTDIVSLLRRTCHPEGRVSLRSVLVVGQIGLAVVLVGGAGLFLRSLQSAQNVELGFDPRNKLLVTVDLSGHGDDGAAGLELTGTLLDRLSGLADIEAATSTSRTPFGYPAMSVVATSETNQADDGLQAGIHHVGPGFFSVLGVEIHRGRGFDARDDLSASPVAIVNAALARRAWPGENPLGKTLVVDGEERTVVGVAADVMYGGLGTTATPQAYVPQWQLYQPVVNFIVRTRGEAAAARQAVEDEIHAVVPDLVIQAAAPMRERVDRMLLPYRATAWFASCFAGLALLLSAAGVYGVQSFAVSRRTREIGIRVALGAPARQIIREVLRHTVILAATGLLLGAGVALALTRVVGSMLFGVGPLDPLAFATAPVVLLIVALVATWTPARRAARIDPITAFRHE